MGFALNTLRDDTETVVLHDAGAADTAKETLLNTLAEPDDSNTGRGLHDDDGQRKSRTQNVTNTDRGDLNGDPADGGPRDADPTRSSALFNMHA